MIRHRRGRLLVASILLAGAACGDEDPATVPATTPAPVGATGDLVEVRVLDVVIAGGTADGAVRWEVRHPRLDGSAVDAVVNEQLRTDAETALDAWRREAEGWGATVDLPSEYVADFEVTLLDDAVLSVLGNGSAYLSGAAHPVGLVSSATFDLTNGERVEVADLFDPAGPWQESLIAATREALAADYGDSVDVSLLDLGPSTDLSVFALTPEGLRLAFPEGTIGPHALGVPSVTIPSDALVGIAAPEGLLGRARDG